MTRCPVQPSPAHREERELLAQLAGWAGQVHPAEAVRVGRCVRAAAGAQGRLEVALGSRGVDGPQATRPPPAECGPCMQPASWQTLCSSAPPAPVSAGLFSAAAPSTPSSSSSSRTSKSSQPSPASSSRAASSALSRASSAAARRASAPCRQEQHGADWKQPWP